MEYLPKGWNSISIIPKEELVEVIDADGNKATAIPTYFPFDVVKMQGDERKLWGWRGTPVFHENNESKWDGGWMIKAVGISIPKIGTIVGWRHIQIS